MALEEDENKAWDKLNEDKDIRSWLKWSRPHYSDNDITNTIYATIAITIVLGLVLFGFNQIAS